MAGEIKFFRKRFFGGFNRKDVVGYIATMAKERNDLESARNKAEDSVRELNREVTALRFETELAWRVTNEREERGETVLKSERKTSEEFEAELDVLRDVLEAGKVNTTGIETGHDYSFGGIAMI